MNTIEIFKKYQKEQNKNQSHIKARDRLDIFYLHLLRGTVEFSTISSSLHFLFPFNRCDSKVPDTI